MSRLMSRRRVAYDWEDRVNARGPAVASTRPTVDWVFALFWAGYLIALTAVTVACIIISPWLLLVLYGGPALVLTAFAVDR